MLALNRLHLLGIELTENNFLPFLSYCSLTFSRFRFLLHETKFCSSNCLRSFYSAVRHSNDNSCVCDVGFNVLWIYLFC